MYESSFHPHPHRKNLQKQNREKHNRSFNKLKVIQMYLPTPILEEKPVSNKHILPFTWKDRFFSVFLPARPSVGCVRSLMLRLWRMKLESITLVGKQRWHIVLLSWGRVPHKTGIVLRLHTVKLQIQPLPMGGAVSPGVCQDPVEGHDVAEGHLQCLVFRQLLIFPPLRNHLPQPIKRRVQALHPLPLPGIGRHPPPCGALKLLRTLAVGFGPGSRVVAAGSTGHHVFESQFHCR